MILHYYLGYHLLSHFNAVYVTESDVENCSSAPVKFFISMNLDVSFYCY